MITNQIMKRPLANFIVEQRTKDRYFNGTELLKQWNNREDLNTQKIGDYEMKDIDDYFNNKTTKQFKKQAAMLINEGFLKTHEDVVNYLRRKFQQKYF